VTDKSRLDVLLVARGLAKSREEAQRLILAGEVRVGEHTARKASEPVASDAEVAVGRRARFVSRGGDKLDGALDAFAIDVTGRVALDVGASTGGFTDVLLARGAARVVALDVGHGQLDWKLRQDPRVVVVEGVNARYLRSEDLPADLQRFDVITIDVSFISLRLILPAIAPRLDERGQVIALVKPQFEAGREEVGRGGIVRDPRVHERVVDDVADAARQVGLQRLAVEPSPVAGAEGNQEFFLLLGPMPERPRTT
jgi:23S rRNA (cytidine1920-2'-O)/16S rRNA (cytidine1409-2'-O)-methyltransferase